jgi:hypothetical protein
MGAALPLLRRVERRAERRAALRRAGAAPLLRREARFLVADLRVALRDPLRAILYFFVRF